MIDICVIGGGPAGMSAAITSKLTNPSLQVLIIEKNPILGKKLHATGNGKCNLSNLDCQGSMEVLKFLDRIGIVTRVDSSGRMYPGSEQAADVVAALHDALSTVGVEILLDSSPAEVKKVNGFFIIQLTDRVVESRKLLIATGGKAGPQYGNSVEGYSYAKALGHHINRTYPVLSPLECEGDFTALQGIRAKGTATLKKNGQVIATETGEIQFTKDGLSGICIFNLSRFVRLDDRLTTLDAFREYSVSVDFLPNMDQGEILDLLQKKAGNIKCKTDHLLLTMVHRNIASDLLLKIGVKPELQDDALSLENLENISKMLKQWECKVTGVKGWKQAQCTGGGVPLEEIDEYTHESKLTSKLYLAGELMDFDGPSGGYNLHYAWSSGIKAGKAMADE